MNAIVVTFDRLPVGFLGCYGNDWIATPNFDRLAAASTLFDKHFADCPAPAPAQTGCSAWWSGRYAFRRTTKTTPEQSLPSLLVENGVTLRLLAETAGEDVAEHSDFPSEHAERVRGEDGLDVPPEETPFARLIARGLRDLRLLRTSRREPWCLWMHSRGIPIHWLPPRSFATQYLDVTDDEEDEPTPDGDADGGDDENGERDAGEEGLVELSGDQFDELLKSMSRLPEDRARRASLSGIERGLMRRVCGGYVSLLDAGFGRLLAPLQTDAGSAPTLLIVTGARGITVREPGSLVDEWAPFSEEMVHTPLLIRATGMNHGTRRQELVQPVDLFPTLAEWFGINAASGPLDGKSLLPCTSGEHVLPRSCALVGESQNAAAIRTNEFYLVRRQKKGADQPAEDARLFAKPEDIWETNDVAAQSPDMVDEMSAQLTELLRDD